MSNELFEGFHLRKGKIGAMLGKYGLTSLEECRQVCLKYGIDVEAEVKRVQPIVFNNAVWAYTLGVACAIKAGVKTSRQAADILGETLQNFCVPGSVAEAREVGIGHGRLAGKLLDEKTNCFCFIAGHESFAASEGAIGLVTNVNKSRTKPLKVVLLGLGKDAAYIISRIGGFTFCDTEFDYANQKLKLVKEKAFSSGARANVRVYGCDSVMEGVEVCKSEQVDVSITGNSTNPTRFQHPVAGTYKMWCVDNGRDYFSIASGGGTGRTLHPDNMGAGPASYGMTDTMGRMHASAQFAGSSSVPAHVNMMGFIGMGNNPIVGATIALSVMIEQKAK
ncbi:MAG: GGGtGRT protein [Firmicutes bacterium]|nr:GGGtGRT protein [Bacillota bacterium]